jgi:hypothetical protein
MPLSSSEEAAFFAIKRRFVSTHRQVLHAKGFGDQMAAKASDALFFAQAASDYKYSGQSLMWQFFVFPVNSFFYEPFFELFRGGEQQLVHRLFHLVFARLVIRGVIAAELGTLRIDAASISAIQILAGRQKLKQPVAIMVNKHMNVFMHQIPTDIIVIALAGRLFYR